MSSLAATPANYIQDPYQGGYLKVPALQNSGAEQDAVEIIVTNQRPSSPDRVLSLSDLQTMLDQSKGYRSRTSSKPPSEEASSGSEHSSPRLEGMARESHPPVYSRIPFLLELYLHLTRVTEALLQGEMGIDHTNRAKRQSIIKKVWLTVCIHIFKEHIEEKLADNRALDEHRLTRYQQIEEWVKLENPIKPTTEAIKPHLCTKTVQQIRSLYVMNSDLGLMTAILATPHRQSSHAKKTMPPAIMVLTLYFHAKRVGRDPHLVRKKRLRVPSITATNFPHRTVTENLRFAIREAKGGRTEMTVYQLLTSLHEIVDIAHQTKTAHNLLLSAHELNAENPDQPQVMILNLPVNQHSGVLRYQSRHGTIVEAMVMADLALFYKFSTWRRFNDESPFLRTFQAIKKQYAEFLRADPAAETLFSQYGGTALSTNLIEAKAALLSEVMKTPATTTRERLEAALVKLYCLKYSGEAVADQLPYGLPVQALFSALDENNLIGCKSANERFFLTEGLTQIFEAFLYESLPDEHISRLSGYTQAFLKGRLPPESFAAQFMKLDAHLNVYGSAIGPSLLDTGTPKCLVAHGSEESIAITGLTEVNTNIFAPSIFNTIAQTNASKVQAHGEKLQKRLSSSLPTRPSTVWRTAAAGMGGGGFSSTPIRLNS
jgi:hypothetical protein